MSLVGRGSRKERGESKGTEPAEMNIEEIKHQLEGLNEWNLNGNSIEKTFKFKNFLESINFVNKVAAIAEKENHHPDIEINYNKVTVSLSTHDEGGVTEKDFILAEKIEDLL